MSEATASGVREALSRADRSLPLLLLHLLTKSDPGMSWQERHAILMKEVTRYWREHPDLALRGWWWRLRKFMGAWAGEDERGPRLATIHFGAVALFWMLVVARVAGGWRAGERAGDLLTSTGLVLGALFGVYCALHALFVYAGFRYASSTVPLLVAADAALAFEISRGIDQPPETASASASSARGGVASSRSSR